MKTKLMIALIFGLGMVLGLDANAQQGGDMKSKVSESSVEMVASFVPEKRAELDAMKAAKLKRESMAMASTAKLKPIPNPEGKPNRMQMKDGVKPAGTVSKGGKTQRSRGGR